MGHTALYDDDILLWSEEQAEIIRRLGRTRRDLPNELDLENVAEEIESVGRSELASVQSQIQNILVHLIKLGLDPHSEAKPHWLTKVFSFHSDMRRRYASSMRQRIGFEQLWRLARKLAILGSLPEAETALRVPERSPFELQDILDDELDAVRLAERLGRSSAQADA